MYRPPDVPLNGALWNDTEDEYLELHNRSNATVSLFDPAYPTNTWKMSGDVQYAFPAGVSLNAGGFLLLVNFDPALDPSQLAAFRQRYQVPAGIPVIGPYAGNLDNKSGKLTLSSPGTPLADGTVPYILLEQVAYSSNAPWPAGADGIDYTLSRSDDSRFGNDPANWSASSPTPGMPNVTLPGPIILQQPFGQLALAGQTVRLAVVASSEDTPGYQWRFNGENIPGANAATIALANAQPEQSGEYSVVVFNTNAATASQPAYVSIGKDSDRDGMDDDWELTHGFNPYDSSDAAADSDGDGFSNQKEYLAGTDPLDSQDCLKIDSITLGSNTVLRFRAAAYRTYSVQYSDSLNPGVWEKLADFNSRPNDYSAEILGPASGPALFYRIVTPQQP
jgi:hypothetical protein